MRMWTAGLVVLPLALAGGPPATVAELEWMAGCWERRAGETVVEEQWMRPAGGLLLGMGRTLRGGQVATYEMMRIEQGEGEVVFTASPARQATTSFRATIASRDSVVFHNPAHDFPTTVGYRSGAPDSLHAWIAGPQGETVRRIDFHYARAACGGGESGAR